jgi:hypothetical protein
MQSITESPDTLIKVVKQIGSGAHTVLPKKWIGKTVKVTLMEQSAGVNK